MQDGPAFYAYVLNRPTQYVDKNGKAIWALIVLGYKTTQKAAAATCLGVITTAGATTFNSLVNAPGMTGAEKMAAFKCIMNNWWSNKTSVAFRVMCKATFFSYMIKIPFNFFVTLHGLQDKS